ncbi:MAG: hypothetical protein WBA48_01490 [Xanthobacteraceae bacterium]
MLAERFDAYGGVVPHARNDDRRAVRPATARTRLALGLLWLALLAVVLLRIGGFAAERTAGFANVESPRQASTR